MAWFICQGKTYNSDTITSIWKGCGRKYMIYACFVNGDDKIIGDYVDEVLRDAEYSSILDVLNAK